MGSETCHLAPLDQMLHSHRARGTHIWRRCQASAVLNAQGTGTAPLMPHSHTRMQSLCVTHKIEQTERAAAEERARLRSR